MINHVALWNLEENGQAPLPRIEKIKNELLALEGKIQGMISIRVFTQPLFEKNADIMLIAQFVDKEALEGYQTHPEHLKVADYVREQTVERMGMDYED